MRMECDICRRGIVETDSDWDYFYGLLLCGICIKKMELIERADAKRCRLFCLSFNKLTKTEVEI